jgi:hypothetical protein
MLPSGNVALIASKASALIAMRIIADGRLPRSVSWIASINFAVALTDSSFLSEPGKGGKQFKHFTSLACRNVHLQRTKKTPWSTERRRYNKLFLRPAKPSCLP